jgi:hypothetical protein
LGGLIGLQKNGSKRQCRVRPWRELCAVEVPPPAPYHWLRTFLSRNSFSIQCNSRLENPLSTKRPCGYPVRHRQCLVHVCSDLMARHDARKPQRYPIQAFLRNYEMYQRAWLDCRRCSNWRRPCLLPLPAWRTLQGATSTEGTMRADAFEHAI